jgi:hypothetical protein
MSDLPIENKVKESGLIQIDLETLMPKVDFASIDISELLWEGLVLKEKDFRAWLKNHNWESYKNKGVRIFCSTDAIIPTWSYMLITSALEGIAFKVIVGSELLLNQLILQDVINAIDTDYYQDSRVIVKGCAKLPSPELALSLLVQKLQPVVKSIMFGEPCSTVPVYKKK